MPDILNDNLIPQTGNIDEAKEMLGFIHIKSTRNFLHQNLYSKWNCVSYDAFYRRISYLKALSKGLGLLNDDDSLSTHGLRFISTTDGSRQELDLIEQIIRESPLHKEVVPGFLDNDLSNQQITNSLQDYVDNLNEATAARRASAIQQLVRWVREHPSS